MKITPALVVLITFSVCVKLGEAASSPPQDDSDYAGGSGDRDPRHWGPTLSSHRPYTPSEEGAVLPPADYDDEDYADYGSGDHVDLVDHESDGGSPAPPAPTTTTTTTTTSSSSTTTTTTTTHPTTTTTTTTTPPPDVLAENGIYGTVDAAYDDYYDEEYYDENYDESYDDEDYGWEGSGAAAGGEHHDPSHQGTDQDGTGDVGPEEDGTEHRDDDIWEDGEADTNPDSEDPIVFDGTTGVESDGAPAEVPQDSHPRPSPDQEVWVPKVGVVPDSPPAGGAASGEEGAEAGDMDGSVQIVTHKEHERHVSVFAQPGMLAAFIGGAVVGLLCAILLVMFVVYRMRKKDEGSYPLDEPKRVPLTSSYASSGKEIYA